MLLSSGETEFRAVFEQSALGMARVRFADARWLDVNRALCQILGRSRDELLSGSWTDITHPDDVESGLAFFNRMKEGALDSYTQEKRYRHKAGYYIWVKVTISLVRDADGNPDYEFAIIEDIRDLKAAEQELAKSRSELEAERKRLQTIVDTIPTGLIMLDENGLLVIENAEWKRTWAKEGMTSSVLDYDSYKGFRPDTGERIAGAEWPCAMSFKQGVEVRDLILDIERFNGKRGTIVVSSSPIRDDTGRVVGAVAANMDITELRRVEEALRIERDRSQSVFDTMTEGFAMIDRDWTVLYMNAEGLRYSGRTEQQVIGRKYWEIWPELVGSDLERMHRRIMETRQPETIEFQYTSPDGRNAWLEGRAYPAMDDGIAVFFRDVTNRREVEDRLRDADRRKDEFLAMLAHELRNPLAPIGAAAQLLQLGQLDEDRVRKTSEVIGRQVSHMTGLIDDLLDVSRVTRGLIDLEKVALDIRHVINDAVEQVAPLIRTRGHALTIRLAPQIAMVLADKKRLVQVVTNVLNNAAKFTPEGGHLVLTTTVQDAGVLIQISDDGIGMTPEMAKHAFDLFAQAERAADRSSGGLGLGLALVKSMVELHGGSVTCSSGGLGKGSLFSIYLPLLSEQELAGPSSPDEYSAQAAPAAPLRILVVDDNVDAAEMLKLLLGSMGHEVLVEHGPYRALERAKLEKPQVFLLDIGLPEIDGNELARRLRAQPENRDATLIAVTGYGQESDRLNALSAGFDHHLVKPVNTSALISILSAIKAH